jgi:DsbC/DsbD-like thiol-disulfide interchange protein/cytochrome c biogenesis protein CcdA
MSVFARILMLWLALCGAAGAVIAQPIGPGQNVAARIEAETLQPTIGRTVSIAFVMSPKSGWHDYWINPGDAGGPLTIEWTLPEGVTAKPLQFPVPTPLITNGFMNHIYKDQHAVLADLVIAPQVKAGTALPIKANARWFACSDRLCVPEQAEFAITLTASAEPATVNAGFDQWRAALPSPLDRPARYSEHDETIEIAVPFPTGAALGPVYFFPAKADLIDHASLQSARRVGDWLIVDASLVSAPEGIVEGLIRIGDDRGLWVTAKPGTVPEGGDPVTIVPRGDGKSVAVETPPLSLLLFGALIGGLLLNIMPCVFPILGLKALSLAKAGGNEAAARRDALAYSAGVILSCLALGSLLLALRAGGEQIGWAFQLQRPGFVFFLTMLMVVITANLFGLFELGSIGGSLQTGATGSFGTGVLSALVATPCTGPFMAAAMGAALLLPVTSALLLFAALGLGLALPFLLLAYIPALRNRLPKPGPWLLRFRQAMAIPMALTALALLWLLYRLTGWGGFGLGLFVAIGLLLLLWIRNRAAPLPVMRLALVLGLLTISGVSLLPLVGAAPQNEVAGIVKTIPFSDQKLASLRRQRKPIFLYFTADWCITCKVNEANAIQTKATKKAFDKAGMVVMEGDYTRQDPAIAGFLMRQGRSGVPLYLYYAPGKDAVLLPQIISQSDMISLPKK